MSEPPAIPVADLRLFVTDPSELAKGAELADKSALTHLARHENKLFADASGSGAAPYKVQIVFGEGGKVTGRCSCMAARSRPFCKHAAALLVSWARAPGAFAQTEAPPAGSLPASPTARRANVKTGNVDAAELRKRGVEQAFTLLSELWQTGVVAIAEDRAGQVAEMASSLRELGLRRLAARTLALAALLEMAARRDGSFPADAYAELFSDLWLTVRKLEKHLGGEPLAPEHVEELIGKTWTKKDRQPIDGLALVEYAFLARTTADGFVLRESRFVDVGSGEHFSEKQILPAMLAKRMPPKPSYRDRVLVGAAGTLYPSFSPRRLDLADVGSVRELDTSTLRATIERALPSMDRALGMLIERRRDPFAPGSVPVLVRVDGMLPGGRARLFDGDGKTLFVGGGREEEDALAGALAGMRVVAVFADVTLEGALPTLLPLAALGERDGAPALVPLGGDDASAREETKRSAVAAGAAGWAEAARAAGVSPAATLLGEVRDDLAQAFHDGVRAAATARFVDPLAARLTELSLGKQADALRAVASAGDPIDALDGLVKVHAVLGIAVSRMASAAPVDRGALVRIPRMPSLAIRAPSELLAPAVAVAREARGELSRWERAYHVAVHYEHADPQKLLADTQTYWGDGFAAPFVVAAAPAHPELAAARAARVLSEGRGADSWRPSTSRLAKLTAIRVLATLGTPAARARLAELGPKQLDRGLLAHARRALHGTSPVGLVELRETMSRVLAAPTMDERAGAIAKLADAACTEAIGVLRAALRDRTRTVKLAAAYALASLGDTGSLDTFIGWLEGEDHELAKIGAHGIGHLGDLRGAGAVLGALARGFSPAIVRETLELLGPWVLGPLLDLALASPEVAKRASVGSLVKTFPAGSTAGTVRAWIDASVGDGDGTVARRALVGLEVMSGSPDLVRPLATWLGERHASALASDDAASKALRKKLSAIEKKRTKDVAPRG